MISDRGLVYITAAPMDGRFRRITSAPLEWRVRNGQQEYKGIYKVKGDNKNKVSHKTKQSYPTAQQALAAIKEESGQIKTLPTDLLYLLQSDASPRSEHVVKATAHVAAPAASAPVTAAPASAAHAALTSSTAPEDDGDEDLLQGETKHNRSTDSLSFCEIPMARPVFNRTATLCQHVYLLHRFTV